MTRASERLTARCLCVSDHRPPVQEYDEHHIHPTYLGGPDIAANRVYLCPTAHSNVHEFLTLMLKAGQAYTDNELSALLPRPVSRYAAALAREGYERYLSRYDVYH